MQDSKIQLNLGCGKMVVDGWINVDYSLGARLAKLRIFASLNKKLKFFKTDWDSRIMIHNLTKRLPWDDSTVDIIYSSHTLEHLTRLQGDKFLSECYRVLKKGGILRIIVPDLAYLIQQYSEGVIPSERFLERLHVLYEVYDSRLKTLLVPFVQFPHKCMYDTDSLIRIMNDKGFIAESSEPFESNIPDVDKIELPDRTINAVIVEAVKAD
jgi:predicted SAM-dependent methyltransferase